MTLAANALPLGLEIGVATYAQVKKEAGSQTRLAEAGTNRYSGGRMLKGNGAGLEVEGLSEIVFIFDSTDRLAGVLMTLPKQDGMGDLRNGGFQKTLKALSGKYKLVDKRVPFVGDAFARLKQGDSVIELEAPHLSFTMELRYMTTALQKAFLQGSANENTEKERRQASRL